MLLFRTTTGSNTIPHQLLSSWMEDMCRLTGEPFFALMTSLMKDPATASKSSPQLVEADTQHNSFSYGMMYLPSPQIINALLYPLLICRWRTLPTHFTKRSGWKCHQLIYTHAGSGIMNAEHQVYRLTPDSLFLLDCQSYHYFYSSSEDGWEYSFIHFSGPSADYLYEQIKKRGLFFRNLDGTEVQHSYDAITTLVNSNPDHFDALFHQHLTALLVRLISSKLAGMPKMALPEWLSDIHAYILEYYNQPLSIHDLACRAHLSDSRFAHIFTEFFGSSPIEYRDDLRMEHAKEYLTNTSLSVEEISQLVGYSTLSAFYTKFEKKVGMAPGKYRKKNL